MKIHVHIYKVVAKAEINLVTKDEAEANEEALRIAKRDKLAFGKSDCEFLAISFNTEVSNGEESKEEKGQEEN